MPLESSSIVRTGITNVNRMNPKKSGTGYYRSGKPAAFISARRWKIFGKNLAMAAHNLDRAGGESDERGGNAAQQKPFDETKATSAYENSVGFPRPRLMHQGLLRVAVCNDRRNNQPGPQQSLLRFDR